MSTDNLDAHFTNTTCSKNKMEQNGKTRIIRLSRRIGRNYALGLSLMSFRQVALKVKKVEKRIQPFICDPETGEVVGQIEFYKLTHCNIDVWTCHTAEENYGKMLELRAAPTPEGSTPLTDAQICEEVLGVRSGYVKGLGHGYEKPSSSSIEYNAELGEALRRADEAEKRNKELEERVDEQNRTIQGLVTDTMDIVSFLQFRMLSFLISGVI
ncbi:uncharacterized protein LOC113329905 [Papaver somniferum]|uniref:uncharacterized protein LOC113329905 n=1 Tax=Papaver somniferum TaxID=3469 RepID=UPI000E70497D|nr:uncharacterized protein LOC113329905 [Papaver somniferum]XP_026432525.1 uncharacterized protein LOC113329905 [Papaver somniferum]XP_026432526.1 uncharacterized protein LOC113329905 [Papaver somniferum]XP_026432527.1 uncharacterized protein LOC113329905 [Papaver somniferum]XP_026432528.1 uncharacterized protein LOC113329905 [Papaver somniferum]XP_026432529.1 uncharacterized protein LOC113329905 [Papaver somniferum]